VICVSETWFVSGLSESSILCDSFDLYHSDRNGQGGGVAIYVNKKLNSKVVCMRTAESEAKWNFVTVFNKCHRRRIRRRLQRHHPQDLPNQVLT